MSDASDCGRRRSSSTPLTYQAGLGRPATPARSLEPARTLEATTDPYSLVHEPDPKSRATYTRPIGHSPSAGAVLTVIIDPDDHSGVTAWMARGADLRHYLDDKESSDD